MHFNQICQSILYKFSLLPMQCAGRGSSIRSVSAWHASGPDFDPHVRYILSWRLGHEIISTAILALPLKKSSCQLLAKECALSTGKLPRRLAQNSVVRVTDRARNDIKCVEGSWNRNQTKSLCKFKDEIFWGCYKCVKPRQQIQMT